MPFAARVASAIFVGIVIFGDKTMAWEKIQPYHQEMADYLNPPSPISFVITKIWTLGIFSGIGNAIAGFLLYAAFVDNAPWWDLSIAALVFGIIGMMVQHTLFDNLAIVSRKNVKLPPDKQLSIHTADNIGIRGLNIFCAVVLTYLAITGLSKRVEMKKKQVVNIEQEIEYQKSVRDTIAVQYDRKIKIYTDMAFIKNRANIEEVKKQAKLDSMQTIINAQSVQLASMQKSLAGSVDYLAVFKFLSFGIEAIAILLSLIAGAFYAAIIDSGFCGSAIVYSNYKYAKYLEKKETSINEKQEKQATAKADEPTVIIRDEEDKIGNIIKRLRARKPDDNVVLIAKYLLSTSLTYEQIGEKVAKDIGQSGSFSTSWVSDVNKALKRMGENAR